MKFLKGEKARVVTDTPLFGEVVEISDLILTKPDGVAREQAKYAVFIPKYDTTFYFHGWELEAVP